MVSFFPLLLINLNKTTSSLDFVYKIDRIILTLFDFNVSNAMKNDDLIGYDLLAELVEHSELPVRHCTEMLLKIIKNKGITPNSITLDELKVVLIDQLSELTEEDL